MKCFKKLIKVSICSSLPPTLDPLVVLRMRSSTSFMPSSPIWTSANYTHLLFVNYSSAFNTIIPNWLVTKLRCLGLKHSLYSWVQSFLSERPQVVKMGNITAGSKTFNTGTPVKRVTSYRYLSVHTSEDLTWITHTSTLLKNVKQILYHLRRLKKIKISTALLKVFFSATIGSVLSDTPGEGNNGSCICSICTQSV